MVPTRPVLMTQWSRALNACPFPTRIAAMLLSIYFHFAPGWY
jgi:hypothetical protein